MPNKINKLIEKGKIIDKEWNENNLSSLINDCIIIENNITEINIINEIIEKHASNKDIIIDDFIEREQINNILDNIRNFGKIISKDNLYDDYKMEKKIHIHKLTIHIGVIFCLCILNDGRLSSGSAVDSIIIYNKKTYKHDIIIKEHKSCIYCIIQLSSGILASCSFDKTIKLFNIKVIKFEILQTLNFHTGSIRKIIELKNKNLASCSLDSSIIFYIKDNNEYKKDYQIKTDGPCSSIVQTRDNEICYSEYNDSKICFFDLLERKFKASISNISKIIPGYNQIFIINIE